MISGVFIEVVNFDKGSIVESTNWKFYQLKTKGMSITLIVPLNLILCL